ncbi:MAG: hypothetical protein N2690_04005 [Rhodocyclaceae bacterium]|nr:hypothetical protein [Rhodocyclaceae bacterium]
MALADPSLLIRLIGREAVETLVSVAGGLAVRIPKRPPLDGPLAELPMPAQEALAAYAGGDVLYIPKCDGAARAARDAAIRAAYDAGARVQDLARQYRLTERWVYEILGRPEDDRQDQLF